MIARLEVEPEVSARLGACWRSAKTRLLSLADEWKVLAEMLLRLYREDPDPGVHGGIDWLLRQKWKEWGQAKILDGIDRVLAGREPPEGYKWYVNHQEQSFAVVRIRASSDGLPRW